MATTQCEKVDDRLYVITRTGVKIGERTYTIIFRLDGRRGAYRVDRLGTLGYIWEAIDGGSGVRTVAAGKSMIRTWLQCAAKQCSLTPTLTREAKS